MSLIYKSYKYTTIYSLKNIENTPKIKEKES